MLYKLYNKNNKPIWSVHAVNKDEAAKMAEIHLNHMERTQPWFHLYNKHYIQPCVVGDGAAQFKMYPSYVWNTNKGEYILKESNEE